MMKKTGTALLISLKVFNYILNGTRKGHDDKKKKEKEERAENRE